MQTPTDRRTTPSLDGREFVLVSSTASAVDPHAPSRFHYQERDGVIWGDYEGDTVTFGRFVGRRTGDDLDVTFAHVLVSDLSVVTGASRSVVELPGDGPTVDAGAGLRLVERFRVGGVDHVSVCVETLPGG